MFLEDKRVLVTVRTGSFGQTVVRWLLSGEIGCPARIVVFSRDEPKQNATRMEYINRANATDEVIYQNYKELLTFRIGDVGHSLADIRAAQAAFSFTPQVAFEQGLAEYWRWISQDELTLQQLEGKP